MQPPLSRDGSGFGQLEVPQVEVVDGRVVLIFNCLAHEFSAARAASGGTGGVWVAAAESLLGPYDIAGATALTGDELYVGKAIRDPAGVWVLLAFENARPDGSLGGWLTDPEPVRCDRDTLVVGRSENGGRCLLTVVQSAAVDSQSVGRSIGEGMRGEVAAGFRLPRIRA